MTCEITRFPLVERMMTTCQRWIHQQTECYYHLNSKFLTLKHGKTPLNKLKIIPIWPWNFSPSNLTKLHLWDYLLFFSGESDDDASKMHPSTNFLSTYSNSNSEFIIIFSHKIFTFFPTLLFLHHCLSMHLSRWLQSVYPS